MVVFLANRANLQSKRLHDRIGTRLNAAFETVRRRRAKPHEPGSYRVIGEVNSRRFFDDDAYPATAVRIEIGFQLQTGASYEYYWFNWIEPERNLLIGWHQDDTHADLGPVHLQVNAGSTAVARHSAQFIDSHPLDVVEHRLDSLQETVAAVEWDQGRPVGFEASPDQEPDC